MLAGAERGDRLRGVQVDGGIDVHRVDVRVAQEILEALVALLHAESLAHRIQLVLRALANGVHVRLGVALVNGDELGSESETDDGDVEFAAHDVVEKAIPPDGPGMGSAGGMDGRKLTRPPKTPSTPKSEKAVTRCTIARRG